MPSIRIGLTTDFNLVGEQVGIGTTNPSARLEVAGQILADNTSGSGGISTLTTYDGFLQSSQVEANTVSIAETTKGNLNSLSGEIKISGEVTITGDTPVAGGRLESLTITDSFDLPHGGSEDREDTPEKGTTRFNSDLGQLEFYTGLEWRTVGSIADTGGRGRGIFAGANAANVGASKIIGYITISTRGNEEEFGELDTAVQYPAIGNLSSSTRGLTMGGSTPTYVDNIQYITIASKGNGIDFGNLTSARHYGAGMSSSTRAIVAGGYNGSDLNVIDYVEIPTLGNALDFGDTNVARRNGPGCASPTRGVFGGGLAPTFTADIQFITISSKGDSKRFGDLTTEGQGFSCGSNSIRGLFNGMSGPSELSTIQYVTIASEGNAIDFGDMTVTRRYSATPTSATRAVFGGGGPAPSTGGNVIDYVDISTAGNAVDFGDLFKDRTGVGSISDSHGGLGGF